MRTRWRAALVLLGLLWLVGPPGPLASGSAGVLSAAAAESDQRGRMVLVLDSSGSMAEPTGSGGTRIDAAREGLTRVVDGLPADAQVGMRVYGATVFDRSQPGACEDSQLVVPLGGAENRDELRQAVAAYQPYGETPIGHALRQAAGDVGPAGARTVVLVSDGEDTCAPPDPCQVAAELRAQGIDLRIDVVGLDVGGNAKAQLQCIAAAGGGEYVDAADAGQLAQALETVATRAVRPFELSGTPVDGTPQQPGAPELAPGTYVDEFPARGTEVFYVVPRSDPASTVWASATLQNAAWAGVAYVRLDADTQLCASTGNVEFGVLQLRTIVSTAASSWQPDAANACNTADRIVVRVSTGSDELVGQPFELRISEEPPVRAAATLPPRADQIPRQWAPMSGGAPGPLVAGGTSFANAVPLQPGVHALELVPGEVQVFSVSLGWGQRLQALATVPPRSGALAEQLSQVTVAAQVFGPDRGNARPYDRAAGMPADIGLSQADAQPAVAPVETTPVAYLNRASPHGDRFTSRAGDYVVTVSLAGDQVATYVLPATLEVTVVGAPGGPPPYDVSVRGADPTGRPTGDPTNGPTDRPTDESTATAAGGAAESSAGWVWPAVGALALLAAAVVALFAVLSLRARRRSAAGRGS